MAAACTIAIEGRRALAMWLAEPGSGAVLECEALVKIDYAGRGNCDGLLDNLATLIDDTTARLRFGQLIGHACLWAAARSRNACRSVAGRGRSCGKPTPPCSLGMGPGWPEDICQLDAAAEFSRIVSAASSS